jgi:putative ABC transport system permease protein
MIVGLIMQQALLLGTFGFAIAWYLGDWIFPAFPRRVGVTSADLAGLAIVVVVISILSSLLGVWKALRIEPNKVLS